MTQPQVSRSLRVSIVMAVACAVAFVAFVAAAVARAGTITMVFLALMVVFGVLGFAGSLHTRNLARAWARTIGEQRHAAPGDGSRRPLP